MEARRESKKGLKPPPSRVRPEQLVFLPICLFVCKNLYLDKVVSYPISNTFGSYIIPFIQEIGWLATVFIVAFIFLLEARFPRCKIQRCLVTSWIPISIPFLFKQLFFQYSLRSLVCYVCHPWLCIGRTETSRLFRSLAGSSC